MEKHRQQRKEENNSKPHPQIPGKAWGTKDVITR
jgi:hypothetical protein